MENLIALWFGLGVAKKIGKDILEWFSDDKPTEKPVEQPKPEPEAHIPLENFKFDLEIFK